MLTLELDAAPTTTTPSAHPGMTPGISAAIDSDRYPFLPSCMHCGSRKGDEQEVWTGDRGADDKSGFSLSFTCHACRAAGRPCSTLLPIRLRPDAAVKY